MTTSKANLSTLCLVFEDRLLVLGYFELVGGKLLLPGPHIAIGKEFLRVIFLASLSTAPPALLTNGEVSLEGGPWHAWLDLQGTGLPAVAGWHSLRSPGCDHVNKPIRFKGPLCDNTYGAYSVQAMHVDIVISIFLSPGMKRYDFFRKGFPSIVRPQLDFRSFKRSLGEPLKFSGGKMQ